VTTTTVQKTGREESLWSALVHFAVDSDCTLDYLRGAKGGYVNAVGCAATPSDFIARVFEALSERHLTLIDCSDVASFTPCDPNENLSPEWIEISNQALVNGKVGFTEFQLYDEGSSYVRE
jgi:hypothetical protein